MIRRTWLGPWVEGKLLLTFLSTFHSLIQTVTLCYLLETSVWTWTPQKLALTISTTQTDTSINFVSQSACLMGPCHTHVPSPPLPMTCLLQGWNVLVSLIMSAVYVSSLVVVLSLVIHIDSSNSLSVFTCTNVYNCLSERDFEGMLLYNGRIT